MAEDSRYIYCNSNNLGLGKLATYFKVWGQSGHLIPTCLCKQLLQGTLAEEKCVDRQINT